MTGSVKAVLIVLAFLLGILVLGVVLMVALDLCPPQGPWPRPPWCAPGEVTLPDPGSLPLLQPAPSEFLVIENAVVIPAAVDQVNYPEMFNVPTTITAEVVDPYCALTREEIAFPVDYLGTNELPTIGDAPLPAEIGRIVGIKDVWIPEPNLNSCPYSIPYEQMRQALTSTLARVIALGADAITFSNYISFINFDTAQLQTPDQAAISSDDLRYITNAAQQAGLDMTLYLNLAPGQGTVSWEIPSEDWLATLINNWEPFVLDQAQLAEETGVDAIMVNHFDYQPSIAGYEGVYQTEMMEIVEKVRSIYSGRILLMIEPTIGADLDQLETLLGSVDGFIFTPTTTPLRDAPDQTMSVVNLKQLYKQNIDGIGELFSRFDTPFLLRVLIQSEKEFLVNGWNEDMFCIPRGDDCYQDDLEVDFSLQAIAYEAILEVIAELHGQTMIVNGIDVYGYWFTDVILPDFSQPQMAHSIRNKPAEAVVFEWFKR